MTTYENDFSETREDKNKRLTIGNEPPGLLRWSTVLLQWSGVPLRWTRAAGQASVRGGRAFVCTENVRLAWSGRGFLAAMASGGGGDRKPSYTQSKGSLARSNAFNNIPKRAGYLEQHMRKTD